MHALFNILEIVKVFLSSDCQEVALTEIRYCVMYVTFFKHMIYFIILHWKIIRI